jgi:uncharacterized membrane protein YphA (DoxX/SURF4 family)
MSSATHAGNGHQGSHAEAEPARQTSKPRGDAPPAGPPIGRLIAELREYFSLYVTARKEQFQLRVQQALVGVVAAVAGVFVLAGIAVTSAALCVIGLAQGLAALLHASWAGNLIVGVVILLALGAVLYFGLNGMITGHKRKTVESHERRRDEQRRAFGHDVDERARRQASVRSRVSGP